MNGEEVDVCIQVVVHVRKHHGELRQMLAYLCFLMFILLQQTLLYDELYIFLLDGQVYIAFIDMTQHFLGKLEFWRAVYQFLHTKHHTEMSTVTHLTQSLEYRQVTV